MRTRNHALLSATTVAILAAAMTVQAQTPAAPPPQIAEPQQFACRGEEPFWQLEANLQSAVLKRMPGKGPKEIVFRGELASMGWLQPRVLVWRGQSTHLPAQTLVATLREESCRSTMADAPPQAWRVILSARAGEAQAGCCTVRSGYDAVKAPVAVFASKADNDWSRRYPEFAAAIRRCVLDGGVFVRELAYASFAGGGSAGMRLIAADGKAWDCTADLAGKNRPRAQPAPDSAPPATGQPVFYPARAEPPIVSCGRLERIPAAGSKVRNDGWLHYDRC